MIKFSRKENQRKRSIKDDVCRLKGVDAFIGDLPFEAVHIGSLQLFIEKRRESRVKTRTINHGLKIVRGILNLAASESMDEFGLIWLASAYLCGGCD